MARGRKKIDYVQWLTAQEGGALAFGAGTAAVVAYNAGTVAATYLRLRGSLMAYIDGASAPGKLVHIGVGMLIVPEGTGTTVTSSPIADANAPWWYYEVFHLGYEEMVTDVVDVPGISSYRAEIDVRSMRKLRPDQEVQLVFENVTIGTASSVNVAVATRALLGT